MEVLTGKQAEVVTSRRQLEEKVALLRPESIDPDLLDEMARGQLQMARPSDLVVYTNR